MKAIGIVTLISALSISAVAAWYSIIGLIAIFSAAAIPIAIMGGVLEIGKLVTAVWLHYNWKLQGHYFIKRYLAAALIMLMLITSMGIFGFLSKAHLEQTGDSKENYAKIEFLERKIDLLENEKEYQYEIVEFLDAEKAEWVKRGFIRRSRNEQKEDRAAVKAELDRINQEQQELRVEKFAIESENRVFELEVGPVLYVAELIYGDDAKSQLDSAVRAVIIALIFVFDPLAILLLIASQISFNAHTTTRKVEVLTDEYTTTDRSTEDDIENTERDRMPVGSDDVSVVDDSGGGSDGNEPAEPQDGGDSGEQPARELTEHERVERKKKRLGADSTSQM